MAEKVFVSPGVYTSEKDLTFVTRQIGVTTLGLVGETTKGPAFQPIFISNYGEFQTFFGGLNNTLVNGPDGNGAPLYELPYIAKSYLSQSNQLFVTRVLGFSGYDAGRAWGITLDAALDPSTTVCTTTNVDPIINYTSDTVTGAFVTFQSSSSLVNYLYNNSVIDFSFIPDLNPGSFLAVSSTPVKLVDETFTSSTVGVYTVSAGTTPIALDPSTTGVTSGPTNNASLFSFTYNTATTTTLSQTSSDPYLNYLLSLTNPVFNLASTSTGATGTYTSSFWNNDINFSGLSLTYNIISTGTTATPNVISGVTTGTTTYYSGLSYTVYQTGTTSGYTTYCVSQGYSDVENKLIALLRSRGKVDSTTQSPVFNIANDFDLVIDPAVSGVTTDPLSDFSLTGYSSNPADSGPFQYSVSMDRTKKNYLTKVLGRSAQDGKTSAFVEEFYPNLFAKLLDESKIRGLNLSLVEYSTQFDGYKCEYKPAVTPYVVSELRGNKVLRLFRLWTISDGNTANEEFKISIRNIKPDTREFDVLIRSYFDTDAQPVILESFSRCTMDPTSNNYVARRIGTLDGVYASKSAFVLLELDETSDTSDAFPAGFIGFPIRDYTLNTNPDVVAPTILYKKTYGAFENKRKAFLGVSNTVGVDSDFFDFKGLPVNKSYNEWTGLTKGFHMDVNATGATIENVKVVINSSGDTYSPIFEFETGDWEFTTEDGLLDGPYEKVFARKFTFVPYGGYDGWDVYRTRRSNLDNFLINKSKGIAGLASGTFVERPLTNGDLGITSDYYAYLEAIWTFKNPEAVNINVFATPGIDVFENSNLIEETIEMVEQDRADSLYIVTTPDTSSGDILTVEDVTDSLDGMYDSNYTATYWPWIQILDAENNVYIYVPPTRDVVRNIALTDNIAFPWFAVAGIQRGDVDAIKARKKLTLGERDVLYENRVNPIATFTSDGIKIWGNKTLQVKDTALNRINVRRLLLQARKLISAVAIRLLFEQNDSIVRNQFLGLVNPILDSIRTERGLTDFRVVLSNDPEEIDRNELRGKIYLKPTRSLEYIIVEFNIMNTGASFDNI
jgi:hypothetical protein